MCGISGYFLKHHFRSTVKPDLIGSLSRLTHRGPDDSGIEKSHLVWGDIGLAQARLSIIDLSELGHQPMFSDDGRYALVYNGEIYNYLELKNELKELGVKFVGSSDTEVLLKAWIVWGESCISRLIGMFAFAVCDKQNGKLTLVRDAFGIKPLFYASQDWGFCFASEPDALLILRGSGAELNYQRAYDYLVHGDYDSNESTFFGGVNQIPPGTYAAFDLSSGRLLQTERWWSPKVIETAGLSITAASKELRELFLDSIRLHLRSDVPLGAALSGGIDSSAVVCAMRYLEPNASIHTFSYIAKDSSESEEIWVDKVNSYINAIPHSVYADSQDMMRDLDEMIICQGEPFGGTSIYAQFRVFKLAKECGVTVTLDGQGADELLAGYHGYPGPRFKSMLFQGHPFKAAKFLNSWSKWPGRSLWRGVRLAGAEFLGGDLYQQLRSLTFGSNVPSWINNSYLMQQGVDLVYPVQRGDSSIPERGLIAALSLAATSRGLPALLRHSDRNSMHFSIESRVPFLTTKLADFTYSLPEHYLVSNEGETKCVFRMAMRGIVPDEILDRRDKVGFSTPESDWLKNIISTPEEWLVKGPQLDFLNHDEICRQIKEMASGKQKVTQQAWRWINFYKWYELVFKPLHLRTNS